MNLSTKILVIFAFLSTGLMAQLPGAAKKLVGEWEYKEGSGFETWQLNGEELEGHAYRVSKLRDTSIVEDLTIKRVNKNLVHIMKIYSVVNDSTITNTYHFLGNKRKLKFINIDSNTPYSIQYKFGFLNRNKLFIKIQYGPYEKPSKLVLKRVRA
jgi:hypothetical protein